MNSISYRKSGFTLLEVLVALAILVFISFSIYQTTLQTYQLRNRLKLESDFYNSINAVMNLFKQDIMNLYSPLTWLTLNPPPKTTSSTTPETYWSAAQSQGIRPARFIGSTDQFSLITAAHIRIYKNAHETDLLKVHYEVKTDPHPPLLGTAHRILVRTVNPNVFSSDSNQDTWVQSNTLLKTIQEMTFTYFQRNGNDWKKFKQWDSENEDTKYQMPDLIEIYLNLHETDPLVFEGTFKFRPEIPLYELPATF